MIEINLKTRIAVLLVTLLVTAMLLQSAVHLFLGMRASVQSETIWAIRSLQMIALQSAESFTEKNDRRQVNVVRQEAMQTQLNQTFSCSVVELADQLKVSTTCRSPETLIRLARLAKDVDEPRSSLVGGGRWYGWLFGSEGVVLAVPIHGSDGRVIGSIGAEHSLVPIFARYGQEMRLASLYLLINAIVLTTLGFLRIVRRFFKPLERLVRLAEQYRPDEQSVLLTSDDDSDFRKLSTSLTSLLDRVERDNQRLRQTVCELEEANLQLKDKKDLVLRSEKLASVGRLSAGMAHEIGNPLTIIQGYVELLGQDDLTFEEKRQFATKAMAELARIQKLIRQLLDFAGAGHLEAQPMSVNALIRDVLAFVTLEKSFADCRIVTRLLAEHDEIIADGDALRQVLINCLLNAADAITETDRGTGEITIVTTNEVRAEAGEVLLVTISDNGTGIDTVNLTTVFDPFFTTKEVGRGTGLGLFVCHTIMEGIGGLIKISNQAGQGAEVELTIPLPQSPDLARTENITT